MQGLINLIKTCQSADRSIYALGVDLENDLYLPMNQEEPLRHGLISPWYDQVDEIKSSIGKGGGGLLGLEGNFGATGMLMTSTNSNSNNNNNSTGVDHVRNQSSSALDSIIPSCYHVPSLPAAATKIASFADETLFYIFYAMPGDRMQELSARELFSRGWRFHKPTKSWLCLVATSTSISTNNNNTTISTTSSSSNSNYASTSATANNNNNNNSESAAFNAAQSTPTAFYVFDQSTWIKVKRTMTLQLEDLEFSRPINSGTASPISSPEIMHGSGTLHSTSVTH